MSQRSEAVKGILQLLVPLIPGAGPYAVAAAQVWPKVRALFVKSGGTPADFDALMAETREGIDKLANPGGFFGDRAPDPLPVPPAPPLPDEPLGSAYLRGFPAPIPDDTALRMLGYQPGDVIGSNEAGSSWMIVRKGQSLMGAKFVRTIGE
jgi:hypothetical protein